MVERRLKSDLGALRKDVMTRNNKYALQPLKRSRFGWLFNKQEIKFFQGAEHACEVSVRVPSR
jgi:hypothetical protein